MSQDKENNEATNSVASAVPLEIESTNEFQEHIDRRKAHVAKMQRDLSRKRNKKKRNNKKK